MARIPDSAAQEGDPDRAAGAGLRSELKRHGAELIGTRPFHDYKTPSLVVSPKTRLLWAPDGDAAFDDGSYVLRFDVGNRVRLIAFKRTEGWQATRCVDGGE